MNKLITIIVLIFISFSSFAGTLNADSIAIINIEIKLNQLENQLKEVRRDELNYKLEKDLLKETYSNNYERINLIITIVLVLFALLGYLGIKDVTSIKKEYTIELSRLRSLQSELEAKVKEFNETTVKYDKEITDIIKQNDEQNKKIKILELKEKIKSLFKEKQYGTALEFCAVALELAPDEISLLWQKARIYTRIRKYNDSIKIYLRIIELDPKNQTAISDLAEAYLFNNQIPESDALVEKHKQFFIDKASGKVLELFELIKLFSKGMTKEMLESAKQKVDPLDLEIKRKRLEGWDLQDAINCSASKIKTNDGIIMATILFYLDGQLSGKEVLERLNSVKL